MSNDSNCLNIAEGLRIDPVVVCREIEELIRTTLEALRRDGAVVALSGGLDSAVVATLTVRSLGTDRVHLLNLPERDSKPIHQKHAKRLAEHLGMNLAARSISPILRAAGSYRLLPLGFIPGRTLRRMLVDFTKSKVLTDRGSNLLADRLQPKANSWLAKGNAYVIAKHRIRMAVIYQYAEVRNLMVVGAANRTEWLTGTFSKWGVDHCADVMPIIHLYRSQLKILAEHLQVPEFIRLKAADPDFIPGLDDKEALLGDFSTTDRILYGIENQFDLQALYRTYGKQNVERLLNMVELSKHMRESPRTLINAETEIVNQPEARDVQPACLPTE